MSTIQLESTSAFGGDGGGGGGAGGEIPNTIAKCAWEIECFILPIDFQMAPFVSAQETSCSLVRHCRAELNFEMVVISRHIQGLPKHFFYADISARSCSFIDAYANIFMSSWMEWESAGRYGSLMFIASRNPSWLLAFPLSFVELLKGNSATDKKWNHVHHCVVGHAEASRTDATCLLVGSFGLGQCGNPVDMKTACCAPHWSCQN